MHPVPQTFKAAAVPREAAAAAAAAEVSIKDVEEEQNPQNRGGAGSSGRDQGKGVEEHEVTASTKGIPDTSDFVAELAPEDVSAG